MAKSLREQIKSNKKNEAGKLIENLKKLNSNKGEGFLKAFPKTPKEIEAEEKEKKDIECKSCEAEEKQILEQEWLDKVVMFFVYLEKAIGGYFRALDLVFANLGYCLKAETVNIANEILKVVQQLTGIVISSRKEYYACEPEKFEAKKKRNRVRRMKMFRLKKRMFESERKLATRMIHIVNHVDEKNEIMAEKTIVMAKEGNKKFNFAREWAEINKRGILKKFVAFLVILIALVAVYNYCTAYEYFYNSRLLGVIKKQEDVLKITSVISDQLSREHSTEVKINPERDITFKRVVYVGKECDDTEEVLRKLTYMRDINVKAYAIFVDGKRVSVLDNKAHANELLSELIDSYTAKTINTKYEKVGFKEKVQIKKIDAKLGALEDKEETKLKLLTGAKKSKIHTVVAGESLSIIARAYGLTLKELIEANPTLDPTKLPIGQKLTVNKQVPMVTLETVEVATYMAPIPYTVVNEEDPNKYQGDKIVKVKGVDGIKDVTARITKENGVQVASKELSVTVQQQPVNEIVSIGTKKKPSTAATGNLKYPVAKFRLTSKYGPRWGGFHTGIDLAAPKGSRISAADGGTVTYAGYEGAYGNIVKVSHGNGIVTVYAHCSSILVKKGDKVYQGQQIATVGSTGNSTGPHCHFEVRVNGNHRNPLNYL